MMKRWKVPQSLRCGLFYVTIYGKRYGERDWRNSWKNGKEKQKRGCSKRHLRKVEPSVSKGSTFALCDANVFYWSRPDRLVTQQQPPVFWIMNELCHRAHRFAIVRRSQIVLAALFKMLKTRPASDKRRIRVGRRIYASGSRHKSSEGNEKRRAVSRCIASPPRYPSENWNCVALPLSTR